jgi:ParB family chromosome partitioning protein
LFLASTSIGLKPTQLHFMSTTTTKRKALGRGLGALLPGAGSQAAPVIPAASAGPKTYFEPDIEDVYPSPEQPRRRFATDELEQLARSIEELGIIQPLIVRERVDGGYTLIAGERRWRAAQRAGLKQVPVVVADVSEAEAFERAIVENIQREDLNAIEEAEAYAKLIDAYSYTQEQVATRVGKDRSTIANALRLLKLPPKVRALVEEGQLSMGHARALLAIDDSAAPGAIETAARKVIARGLSVRATESLVRSGDGGSSRGSGGKKPSKSASVRDLEARLTKSLGAQIAVNEDSAGSGGAIEIRYANLDDLDRLLARLLK